MIHKLFIVLLAIHLTACGSSGDGDNEFKSIDVKVKNSTDRRIVIHHHSQSWSLANGDYLKDETTEVNALEEHSFVEYYDIIPDIHITGTGIDIWFNALTYENDRFTVRQSDVVTGDG